MKYENLKEELEVESDISKINKNFREYLEQVFSKTFLKKLDRVFSKPLIVENFKQNSNVMALTSGTNIYVNVKMFKELPTKRAMVYIIHELFHVLQNVSQFPEVKTLNRMLGNATMKYVPKNRINEFLTGKAQDIHSDYKNEFLSYCSNFAFNWKIAPELKNEYFRLLDNSGLFDMNSEWWKERFIDKK